MAAFAHKIHEFIIVLVKYFIVVAVLGFMPIPLLSYFGGDLLHQSDHTPLFQYFDNQPLKIESILQNKFTNVFISKDKKSIESYEIDNAVFWTEYFSHSLNEKQVPVVRKIISMPEKAHKKNTQSHLNNTLSSKIIKSLNLENNLAESQQIEWAQNLIELKQKYEILLLHPIAQNFRQWIILSLGSQEKQVKKELKKYAEQYPNDHFLVLSLTPMKINKKVKSIQFPKIDTNKAVNTLSEILSINYIQSQILLTHFGWSFWNVNKANNMNTEFTLLTLLGQFYFPFQQIPKKQGKILEQVCQKGKAKYVNGVELDDYGVIVKNKHFIWQNELAELNYEIFKQVTCEEKLKKRSKEENVDGDITSEKYVKDGDVVGVMEDKGKQNGKGSQSVESTNKDKKQQKQQKQNKNPTPQEQKIQDNKVEQVK